uniref:Uncharacterized protein n=1 Tax=viral metagenome TaxID=1070528 RepID=A0A6C0DLE5_9ZZZZ
MGDIPLNVVCQQRKLQMLFNVPPIRYENVSPYVQYPQFKQKDFDMRRKVEILKYEGNKTNTKTNKFKKTERWAQLVNGKTQKSSFTSIFTTTIDLSYVFNTTTDVSFSKYTVTERKATVPDCSMDDLIPTPTSSSGVPGPISYLVYNPNVPLYNYVTQTNAYAFTDSEDYDKWKYNTTNDIKCQSGVETKIFTLYIKPNIDQYSYTYSFNIPIGIYVNGTNISNTILNKPLSFNDIILNINSIELTAYYSNQKVTLQKTTSIVPSKNISMNYNISFTPTNIYSSYTAILYSGMLQVSNVYLFTEPGYIYDIYMKFNLDLNVNTNTTYNSSVQTTSYGVICNLSSNNKKTEVNTTITSSQRNDYSGFYFNGL